MEFSPVVEILLQRIIKVEVPLKSLTKIKWQFDRYNVPPFCLKPAGE
jgi:hypothetical protein